MGWVRIREVFGLIEAKEFDGLSVYALCINKSITMTSQFQVRLFLLSSQEAASLHINNGKSKRRISKPN